MNIQRSKSHWQCQSLELEDFVIENMHVWWCSIFRVSMVCKRINLQTLFMAHFYWTEDRVYIYRSFASLQGIQEFVTRISRQSKRITRWLHFMFHWYASHISQHESTWKCHVQFETAHQRVHCRIFRNAMISTISTIQIPLDLFRQQSTMISVHSTSYVVLKTNRLKYHVEGDKAVRCFV